MSASIDLTYYCQINKDYYYDRYFLLGGGSYGKVYKGWDNKQSKPIAVKHILKSSLMHMNGLEQRELDIMNKLKHPNIMGYYGHQGSKNSQDGLFIFLQLCEKGTLKQKINKKMTQMEAYELFMQLVDGMAYVNEQKIFHRDLKPQNLLLTASNELKIADFGIARGMVSNGDFTMKRCTAIYAAPQVYIRKKGGNYNQKCDVFSAGYILYEMLTGERLTDGIVTEKQLIQFWEKNQAKGGFTFEHPNLKPQWITFLKGMLDFNIQKRFSFAEIKQKLKTFLPPVKGAIPISRPHPQKRKIQSNSIKTKMKTMIEFIKKRDNYLTSVLRIFTLAQKQKSHLVPRVYKLILIYMSLQFYCSQVQKNVKLLNKRQLFLSGYEDQLSILKNLLIPQDQSELMGFIDLTANSLNKSFQQLKHYMLQVIIPQLQAIFNKSENDIEKKVLQQMKMMKGLKTFKESGQYENLESFYIQTFIKCMNNLYQTTAQLQILSILDLKIYLVILHVGNLYKISKQYNIETLPPKFEDVCEMNIQVLKKKIQQLKNKE